MTLNDVVIAACAGSLRDWLQARDALPAIPTIVSVPVSTRTEEQQGTFGNRVSMLIGQFPTHIADPLRRLQAASASMSAAKERHEAIGPELLADLGVFMMPSLLARANRAFQRTDMPLLIWNVAVTNVPGPRHELYFAGRRLEAIKPVGFLVDDLGVMMAFIGYRDKITLGMLTCPDLVPGADELVDGVRNGIRELAALSRTSIADRGPVNGVPPAGPAPAARAAAPDRPVVGGASDRNDLDGETMTTDLASQQLDDTARGPSFALTDEQKALQEMAHAFAAHEIRPRAAEYDEHSTHPADIIAKAHALGLMNRHVDERFGGPGLSAIATVVIEEEMHWGCAGIGTALGANDLGSTPVRLAGTEEQQHVWLSPLIDEPILCSFGLTEPEAGSDVASLATTAVRRADSYVLNGAKTFITNGGHASLDRRVR